MKYVATIARRWTGDGYVDLGGYAVSEGNDTVHAVPLANNPDWAAQAEEIAAESVGDHPDAEAFLRYLWARNSTVTSYSQPTPIVANSPAEAVRKLAERQETA